MLSKTSFEITPGARTSFGVGAVHKLGKRVRALGHESALVITDAGLVRAGVVDQVMTSLESAGVRAHVFDGVVANPHVASVMAGADAWRTHGASAVIALGGGSAMDAAKAIALIGPNGGALSDYPFGCKPKLPAANIFAVPTTAGTGSETNMFGVITDPALGRKVLIAHTSTMPVATVLDPELTLGVPQKVTATCGMDVLTHAIEALTCRRNNPFADALALRAIELVGTFLPRAFDDGTDLEARANLLFASHLAGIAFSNSGLGICHAMGHPLSARFDAAHGQSLATLLPHVMRFNLDVVAPRYAQVAFALGVGDRAIEARTNAERAIAAVTDLRARVATDLGARALGVTPDNIPMLVEDALADSLMAATPRSPQPAEVAALYAAALPA